MFARGASASGGARMDPSAEGNALFAALPEEVRTLLPAQLVTSYIANSILLEQLCDMHVSWQACSTRCLTWLMSGPCFGAWCMCHVSNQLSLWYCHVPSKQLHCRAQVQAVARPYLHSQYAITQARPPPGGVVFRTGLPLVRWLYNWLRQLIPHAAGASPYELMFLWWSPIALHPPSHTPTPAHPACCRFHGDHASPAQAYGTILRSASMEHSLWTDVDAE